ncbi:MAG: HAD-IC family P-type ATPase, partial [Candidatus Bipolaricaulota bacterium]|nr:HAD-IC family P-type ATPase [Candidatus Bipolaricaulota bacterium]
LEAHSNHPLARAIVEAVEDPVPSVEIFEFSEEPGRGVRGIVDGRAIEVCSPRCARETAGSVPEVERAVAELEDAGLTVLALIIDGTVAGCIGLEDAIRPGVIEALERLRAVGIEHLVMLTGDNERVARAVAAHAGLTEYRARLLPEHKAEAVGELKRRFGMVAMVGDGVNDAPALAAADIGIAMGAAGSDIALETADVALMRDDLGALAGFFLLGKRTMRI